ncbi:MAG TPA: GrpB family protein, partial [Gammaproteobacteria bacterium]
MQLESLEQRIARLIEEEVEIRPYDPDWVRLFEQESSHLRSCLPGELIRRIEHFGSTAVPGLAAKPIVDMLVEVTDLKRAKQEIV